MFFVHKKIIFFLAVNVFCSTLYADFSVLQKIYKLRWSDKELLDAILLPAGAFLVASSFSLLVQKPFQLPEDQTELKEEKQSRLKTLLNHPATHIVASAVATIVTKSVIDFVASKAFGKDISLGEIGRNGYFWGYAFLGACYGSYAVKELVDQVNKYKKGLQEKYEKAMREAIREARDPLVTENSLISQENNNYKEFFDESQEFFDESQELVRENQDLSLKVRELEDRLKAELNAQEQDRDFFNIKQTELNQNIQSINKQKKFIDKREEEFYSLQSINKELKNRIEQLEELVRQGFKACRLIDTENKRLQEAELMNKYDYSASENPHKKEIVG